MSTHRKLEEAHERHESVSGGHDRLVPLVTACIAVLAALGSLFAHHRSIVALSVKNDSIIATAKATDQFNIYQSQRLEGNLLTALLPRGDKTDADARADARRDVSSATVTLAKARAYENDAFAQARRSEALLGSFETLEISVTLFEIAIVFASISALTQTRFLLWGAVGLSALGIIFIVTGYFQAH